MSEIEALRVKLDHLGVPSSAYGLAQDKPEAFCLVREGTAWSVYYSERGERVAPALHATFAEASEDFLSRLFKSRSVQRMMREEHWRLGSDGRLFLAPPTAAESENHNRQ